MVEIKGGDRLASVLKELSAKVSKASTLSVGFMGGATEADGASVPMVAAIQEFGAPSKGIPPRPFFRNMIAAKSDEWGPALGNLLTANDYDAAKCLAVLGSGIEGQLQQSIIDTNDPPLSPVTVMLRGMRGQSRYDDLPWSLRIQVALGRVSLGQTNYGASTKPLVDTGTLLNSITSKVE